MESRILREVYRINDHLPARRPTLAQLLEQEEPKVVLRNGDVHHFRRSELELLRELVDCPERLRLPIVLEIVTDFRGYFRVRDDESRRVVEKILGVESDLFPRYLLPRLRKTLPTTTTYAFLSGADEGR